MLRYLLKASPTLKRHIHSQGENFSQQYENLRCKLEALKRAAEQDNLFSLKISLYEKMQAFDVWDCPQLATSLSHQLSTIESTLNEIESTEETLKEVLEYYQLALSEDDQSSLEDCRNILDNLSTNLKTRETEKLFVGKQNDMDCYVQINAGVGGTESCDWASMLYSMYSKWANLQGYRVVKVDETIDSDSGGGFRSITFKLYGNRAYGWLKADAGVHRLVRISPFDPKERRHTSFAQVLVYPDFDGDAETYGKIAEINPKELRIETKHASGPGGQSVNTTDSAVRITHIPTGIVVSCQNERSQHQNKAFALSMLRSKLTQYEKEKKDKLIKDSTIGIGENSWGNQIRSIVLHPYQLVKDHRTSWQSGDIDKYLSGQSLSEAMQEALLKQYQDRKEVASLPNNIVEVMTVCRYQCTHFYVARWTVTEGWNCETSSVEIVKTLRVMSKYRTKEFKA